MELNKIYNMDCLKGLRNIPDGSVDCIICDLPYGTTACKWDSVIPFDRLWKQYKRIRKPSAPILLFGSEPFSTKMRMSNLEEFRYDWIWVKNKCADFVHAKNRPMKSHEIISVFCKYGMGHKSTMGKKRMPYIPQGLLRKYTIHHNATAKFGGVLGKRPSQKRTIISEWTNYPTSVLQFDIEADAWHPTQKPISLIRYLIKTYTQTGGVILDNCMGSGTTAIACIREKRDFIGFEINKEYYEKACKRIKVEMAQPLLF